MNKKLLFRWTKVILLLYGSLGLAFYYVQDKLLFQPVAVEEHYNYAFPMPYKEVNIPISEHSRLNLVQFTSTAGGDSTRGVVLYFHGNKKNVSWYARFAPYFTKWGYEVWMPDYAGYGKSTGKFTEQELYDWALITYKLARTRYRPDQIIIYGKSLGTGMAAQLASIRDCQRLILETPYYDFASVLKPYLSMYPLHRMLRFQLPTRSYLPEVTAPITIFHGTADCIVLYRNTRQLMPLLKPGDEVVTVKGGSHNDLYQYNWVINKLDTLLP